MAKGVGRGDVAIVLGCLCKFNPKGLWVSWIKQHGGLKRLCAFLYEIHLQSRTGLECKHYIGDEECENNPYSGMASTRIQSMVITGSKSGLSERWRVWLPGFTYFAEGKANLQNAARKKSELLYRAGSGVLLKSGNCRCS